LEKTHLKGILSITQTDNYDVQIYRSALFILYNASNSQDVLSFKCNDLPAA